MRTSSTFSPLCGGFHGALGVEIHLAGGRAGAGGQAPGNALGRLDGGAVKDRRQHLVELVGRDAADGRLPVDQFLLLHFDGEADGGQAGAFAVAGLEHEDLAVFDGELEVLHVVEMLLQGLADCLQFGEGRRALVLQLRPPARACARRRPRLRPGR